MQKNADNFFPQVFYYVNLTLVERVRLEIWKSQMCTDRYFEILNSNRTNDDTICSISNLLLFIYFLNNSNT